jgi:eukaryotic-like serine/threonine-protein kinase
MSEPHDGTQHQLPDDVARLLGVGPRARIVAGDPLPGLTSWILERKLGGGGFGEVWLVRHEWKDESRAVKFCFDPEAQSRLTSYEKQIVVRVMRYTNNNPNIVPLLECNLSGNVPWLMYEYVEGGTLADAITESRALAPPRRLGRAARILYDISAALATMHRLNPPIVHRDLKPQNVLMAGRVPRITDFGIGGTGDPGTGEHQALSARMPTVLQTAGSSKYAPPEQMFGSPPNPRDDVFALGVIAYQLVMGDLSALPNSNTADQLRALRVPAELAALISRSTDLNPDRRPRDAGEWERDLGALVKKKTAGATTAPAVRRPDDSRPDSTEPMDALGESELGSLGQARSVELHARGRWYARPVSDPRAGWQLVSATPGTVHMVPEEVYRFSVYSAATEDEVLALGDLVGSPSVVYLNLSFCAGVTDRALGLLVALPSVRQLFLRDASAITDAGLVHLRALKRLRMLDLSDCPQLSAAAVADLQAALPNCTIRR